MYVPVAVFIVNGECSDVPEETTDADDDVDPRRRLRPTVLELDMVFETAIVNVRASGK